MTETNSTWIQRFLHYFPPMGFNPTEANCALMVISFLDMADRSDGLNLLYFHSSSHIICAFQWLSLSVPPLSPSPVPAFQMQPKCACTCPPPWHVHFIPTHTWPGSQSCTAPIYFFFRHVQLERQCYAWTNSVKAWNESWHPFYPEIVFLKTLLHMRTKQNNWKISFINFFTICCADVNYFSHSALNTEA